MLAKKYVLDSHALIVYFQKKKGWEEVESLLYDAAHAKHQLYMSLINLGEVFYIRIRDAGEQEALKMMHVIKSLPIQIAEPDYDSTLNAARYKAAGGLSYADCFAAVLAKKEKAIIVTGDVEFKRVEDKIKVKWL